MKRRFVLATNSTTAAEDQVFKDRLNAEFPGLGWWHRLGELWLITESKGRLDAKRLRDLARECFSGKRLLVLEINADGDTWAGLGEPAGNTKETFAWLHTQWKKE